MERTNEGQRARCDCCGCAFVPEPITEVEGDIAYTFFRCDYCGKAFIVCVTDTELRNSIYEYSVMAARNEIIRMPEKARIKMRKLKDANKRRADELRRMYLREAEDGGTEGA